MILRALCVYNMTSVPIGFLKEIQISTLNYNRIFCINNKYFIKMITTMNITFRQSRMIACSQSTVHFKSCKYFIIKCPNINIT